MSRLRAGAPFLAFGFLLSACDGSPYSETAWRQSLRELVLAEHDFAALASDSTVQHAFTASIAADAILFRPGPVPGPEALAAQPMPDWVALLWEPAFADVSLAGDLGYTTGPWRSGRRGLDSDSPGGAGQYVTLWRRTPGGFRFVLDAGIAHEPADPRSTGTLEPASYPGTGGVRGATGDSAPTSESLRIADQDLGAALGDQGVAAYRSYAVDSVRVLREGRAPLFGIDALITAAPPSSCHSVNAGAEASASGDLGYTWGAVRPSALADAAPLGYYVRIWRRQADGSWQMVLDLVTPAAG